MDALVEPFSYAFFRNGLFVCAVAGALCGLVGTYVVLKGMSAIGHGLSHAIFGGAAIAAVLRFNYFVAAGLWGLASALLVGRVTRRRLIGSDAAIGTVTTASFALGLVLINLFSHAKRSTEALLFGSALGVGTDDVLAVSLVAAGVAVAVFLRYRQLLFSTFDPEVAEVSGVRVGWEDALLMLLLAASILATINVLGVTLIAAQIVIPPATARMLTSSFSRMVALSVALGAASGFTGMYLSWHLDVPSGAAVTLVSAAGFVMAFLATGTRGLRRVATVEI